MDGQEYEIPASIKRALQKAAGTCTSCHPQLIYLEDLAQVAKELQPSVDELRVMHDHLEAMTRVGMKGVMTADGPDDRG